MFISLSAGPVVTITLRGLAGLGAVGLYPISVGTVPHTMAALVPQDPGPEEAAGPHSALTVSSDLLES